MAGRSRVRSPPLRRKRTVPTCGRSAHENGESWEERLRKLSKDYGKTVDEVRPNQPAPAELAGTIEHLTGRPADPAEVQQVMNDTQATYSDFAPGGQVAPSGTGGTVVQ